MNWLRVFFIKRKIKRSVVLFDSSRFEGKMDRVGVLLDGNHFDDARLIEDSLRSIGIGHQELVFKILRKDSLLEVEKSINYCPSNIKWNAEFKRKDLASFIENDFDLLISYYDQPELLLKYLKYSSKAKFKIGFSKLNDPINQLDIDTDLSDCSTFCLELKKYLTLLKNN